jgi:hypothetical protein
LAAGIGIGTNLELELVVDDSLAARVAASNRSKKISASMRLSPIALCWRYVNTKPSRTLSPIWHSKQDSGASFPFTRATHPQTPSSFYRRPDSGSATE